MTGIGFSKDPNAKSYQWKRSEIKRKEWKRKPVKIAHFSKRRQRENKAWNLVKELVAIEYYWFYFPEITLDWFKSREPDHRCGRQGGGRNFKLFLEFSEIQYLLTDEHSAKTNSVDGTKGRKDFRPPALYERLCDLSDRVRKGCGPVYNLKDFIRACREELEAQRTAHNL